MTRVKGCNKKVNIIVEPVKNRTNSSVVAVPSYTILNPGSSKVNINIRNLTGSKIMVNTKLIIPRVASHISRRKLSKNRTVKQENRIPQSEL